MTSNNETVSRQNLWAGNIAQSMTSEGYTVHCYPRMSTVNMNSSSKSDLLYSLGKQLILFSENLNVSLGSPSGNIEILGKQN